MNAATDIAGWVQSGGILAFAGAVLWELRQQRNERNQQNKVLTALLHDLNTALSILLDRSGEKRRKPTNPSIPIPPEGESQ